MTTDTTAPDPMTLSELIGALEAADPATVVPDGFRFPHSYRGYYAELAFEPARNVTVAQMFGAASDALGATFEGWKGGDFTMTEDTPCWLAFEGACGEELTAERLRAMLAAGRGQDGQADEVERLRAELAETQRTRDAYLGEVNAHHEFLGYLLELLPGATDEGMDAGDQIPRGIEKVKAERDRLAERLKLADAVCLLFGWSPSRDHTEREKALTMLWRRWAAAAPPGLLDPAEHPELSDEAIAELARQRDEIRARTLTALDGTEAS